MSNQKIIIALILALLVAFSGYYFKQKELKAKQWSLEGRDALIIGEYGDNFAYDGNNVRSVDGKIILELNSKDNSGHLEVMLENVKHQISKNETLEGKVRLVMEDFYEAAPFQDGGIVENLWMHGDTGNGPPVMPKIYTFLAGWGSIDIYVGEELVYNDLDGHFMYTERARKDNKIMKEDGTIYNPTLKSERGFTDSSQREFHLVAHSHIADENNFPSDTEWIHLNFQEVALTKVPEGVNLFVPINHN